MVTTPLEWILRLPSDSTFPLPELEMASPAVAAMLVSPVDTIVVLPVDMIDVLPVVVTFVFPFVVSEVF